MIKAKPVFLPRRRALVAVIAPAFLLSACAATGDYPSLARRDAERVSGTVEPVPSESIPPAPTAPSAALGDRLAHLMHQAESAHRAFAIATARTRASVASAAGAAPASEAWAVATVALADLEASRSAAMIALAELDSLHVADAVSHFDGTSGDGGAIAAARDSVIALIAAEDVVLAELRGRLRS